MLTGGKQSDLGRVLTDFKSIGHCNEVMRPNHLINSLVALRNLGTIYEVKIDSFKTFQYLRQKIAKKSSIPNQFDFLLYLKW